MIYDKHQCDTCFFVLGSMPHDTTADVEVGYVYFKPVCIETPLPPRQEVVELGLLVYSVCHERSVAVHVPRMQQGGGGGGGR